VVKPRKCLSSEMGWQTKRRKKNAKNEQKYRAKWRKDLSVVSLELGAALMTPAG